MNKGYILLLGTLAAYSLARFSFRFKEDIAFTFLSFRFAPELMVILPLYVAFQKAGLIDSYSGLTAAYQLITLPFMIWVLRGFFEDIPREIEQAARVDGYTLKILLSLFGLRGAEFMKSRSRRRCFG
jgi:multiple sugar transport system permease protein